MFNRKAHQRFYTHNAYDPRFGPMPSPYPQSPPMMSDPNMSSMYPEIQSNRLQMEIMENRRRINNLAKRIIRIENYLRIRDTSDYSIVEDEHIPEDYPM
ncbi:MAG TPA: hypothetical protein GX390_00970 [Acholeplasmataceae bacterium]|jgi:hypothetical protein|nr:hypothetical protein [Acholeplasmataceae bacterium]